MASGPDILVIDDDRDLVNSVRIILESRDYQVRTAHNGQDGLKLMQEKTPDLLILDVMMTTDTEGFDLAFKLSRDPRFAEMPILMVSGFPQVMAEQGPEGFQHIMGEAWPVSDFLEKPVDPDKLLAVVKNLLAGH
jgi:two-component system alkaline phosphatase synthesis response regulator PhoP